MKAELTVRMNYWPYERTRTWVQIFKGIEVWFCSVLQSLTNLGAWVSFSKWLRYLGTEVSVMGLRRLSLYLTFENETYTPKSLQHLNPFKIWALLPIWWAKILLWVSLDLYKWNSTKANGITCNLHWCERKTWPSNGGFPILLQCYKSLIPSPAVSWNIGL